MKTKMQAILSQQREELIAHKCKDIKMKLKN